MDKKVSYIWAWGVGLLFVVLNIVMFLFRFGVLNTEAPITDYVMFFLAGALIGVILIYLLRRSHVKSVYNATMTAFVISLPFALFGMMFGGVVGVIGIFLLGVSPAVFILAVGHYLAWAFARK